MTARAPTADQLKAYAEIAREEGVTITIEAGGRVYRITPGGASLPMSASERDRAACDEAFGQAIGRSA